jgi:hypothetical protein
MKQAKPPLFDFATEVGRQGWRPSNHIARLSGDHEGMRIEANGNDPYTFGPIVTVPANTALWLRFRLKASEPGMGQVFYFPDGTGATEENSVRFPVRAGGWEEVRVPLPSFAGTRYGFRIDPPGGLGSVTTIALLDVEPRIVLTEPTWRKPSRYIPTTKDLVSGDLGLAHSPNLGGFALRVGGEVVAVGHDAPQIGYQTTPDTPLRWIPLSGGTAEAGQGRIRRRLSFADADGANWTLTQTFTAGKKPGSISVETTTTVSADRYVAYLPLLVLLPGAGSFGASKEQALFGGVEYLDKDEPSSSEADLTGPQAKRHVPDSEKLTIPLMVIRAHGRYIGLAWEPSEHVAAFFDSPDRRYGAGGHVMALLYPGTAGMNAREPGAILPHAARLLPAQKTVTVRATIYGGRDESVLGAVRAWVTDKGLPALPPLPRPDAVSRLFAAGWLDSRVRERARYRHAYPGDFGAQPAMDATLCESWLAGEIGPRDRRLAERLRAESTNAKTMVAPSEYAFSGVGHVRTPAGILVHGDTAQKLENLNRVRSQARDRLRRFTPDGTVPYQATPGRLDYGKTHFANHANGITGEALARVLEAAVLTGDPELAKEGVVRLRQTDTLYRNTVPRGAQTWEVPLHTPDILASAHLVRAFTLGYDLTGDAKFLDSARYWAWTGVPFTYLVPPTRQPVGLYATTPVLGATQWVAPNWIGLPVQWCGLVYADALYDLAVQEAGEQAAFWKKLADGIVISAVQQTWPIAGQPGSNAERQGLLPDSFSLVPQIRNDVAINPATTQVPYARMVGRPLYGYLALGPGGPYVHAPGKVSPVGKANAPRPRVLVEGWPEGDYTVLFSAVKQKPREVRVNGKSEPFEYLPADGWLLVTARGKVDIEVV